MNFPDHIRAIDPDYAIDVTQAAVISELQAAVCDPNAPGVLLSAYPGWGKSKLFTVLLPLWLIHLDLMTHVICTFNADSLGTTSHTMVRRCIESPAFQDITPCTLAKANEHVLQIEGNDGQPTLHSAGILGQLTGRRANFLVFDDLIKNLQIAFSETARDSIISALDSAAQTRLLPGGKIFGVHTRWSLNDPIQVLIDRARKNPRSRQYRYINIAARNLDGTSSYILDTRTNERTYFDRYPTAATIPGLPISYSEEDFAVKEADLGPRIFSPLFMGDPLSGDELMFPPECWGYLENLNLDEYSLLISAWDTASRIKATNDPSCNVVVGRRNTGDFVVLDCFECKFTADKLLPIILERYRRTCEAHRAPVYLCIEEADSGKFLIDIIAAQFPQLPLLRAKAVVGKIIRAESVAPFTAAGSVSLLRANWNERFVSDHANFPASSRDHSVDAFCHAMRAFTGTGSDFQKPALVPVRQLSRAEELYAELVEELPYPTDISDEFSTFESNFDGRDW